MGPVCVNVLVREEVELKQLLVIAPIPVISCIHTDAYDKVVCIFLILVKTLLNGTWHIRHARVRQPRLPLAFRE
jgi:hypothetical protein